MALYAEPGALVLLVLAVWEAFGRSGFVARQDLPPFSDVAAKLIADVQGSVLWHSLGASFEAWALGLGIVVAAGVPIGAALGSSQRAYRATNLLVEFVRTIPSIALLPLLILLYGAQLRLAVTLVVLSALWPLLIQTMYGVHDVDPVARDTARAYGLGRARRFMLVVLPSALPYIATGLRLSAVIALILAIAASLIAGGEGLGSAISSAATSGQTALMYGRILVAGCLGLLVTLAFATLERRVLHWHPTHRESHP